MAVPTFLSFVEEGLAPDLNMDGVLETVLCGDYGESRFLSGYAANDVEPHNRLDMVKRLIRAGCDGNQVLIDDEGRYSLMEWVIEHGLYGEHNKESEYMRTVKVKEEGHI